MHLSLLRLVSQCPEEITTVFKVCKCRRRPSGGFPRSSLQLLGARCYKAAPHCNCVVCALGQHAVICDFLFFTSTCRVYAVLPLGTCGVSDRLGLRSLPTC